MNKIYTAKTFTSRDSEAMRKFLLLPADLYGSGELTQNTATEKALLCGEHTLSRYFEVIPIIVTDENGAAAARCTVTLYPDRDDAYFGFFECVDDTSAAKAALELAEQIAAEHGRRSMIGPVDCSFWIGYRLKTDRFGKPYTGEPYNLPYYKRLLEECGYAVCEEYISNYYEIIPKTDRNPKNEKRFADMTAKGYIIAPPKPDELDRLLEDVYVLLIELYSTFPTFSRITREEFIELFTPLTKLLDCSMIRMAYFEGKPVGFFITLPDYGNALCGSMTPEKLQNIMSVKSKPKGYILLYLGADKKHPGLGTALVESLKQELAKNGAYSYGALIRRGKVSGVYFKNLISGKCSYCLYSKKI